MKYLMSGSWCNNADAPMNLFNVWVSFNWESDCNMQADEVNSVQGKPQIVITEVNAHTVQATPMKADPLNKHKNNAETANREITLNNMQLQQTKVCSEKKVEIPTNHSKTQNSWTHQGD